MLHEIVLYIFTINIVIVPVGGSKLEVVEPLNSGNLPIFIHSITSVQERTRDEAYHFTPHISVHCHEHRHINERP